LGLARRGPSQQAQAHQAQGQADEQSPGTCFGGESHFWLLLGVG
jgi:hypothetical protein